MWKVRATLSIMESSSDPASAAAAALRDADAASTRMAGAIRLPSGFLTSISAVVALQIATTAAGAGSDATWGGWALAGGLAAFLAVGATQLARFRRLNGVWLGGLADRVVLGTAPSAWIPYAAAIVMATWAASEDQWSLTGACAVLGGAAYGLSGRHWMQAFHAEPQRHGPGSSIIWLAILVLAAIAGLIPLLLSH
jgi:hypothetical protein